MYMYSHRYEHITQRLWFPNLKIQGKREASVFLEAAWQSGAWQKGKR